MKSLKNMRRDSLSLNQDDWEFLHVWVAWHIDIIIIIHVRFKFVLFGVSIKAYRANLALFIENPVRTNVEKVLLYNHVLIRALDLSVTYFAYVTINEYVIYLNTDRARHDRGTFTKMSSAWRRRNGSTCVTRSGQTSSTCFYLSSLSFFFFLLQSLPYAPRRVGFARHFDSAIRD